MNVWNPPYGCRVVPFVGVCGLRTVYEYRYLVSAAERMLPGTGHFIMAGIKDGDVSLPGASLHPAVRPFMHCDYRPEQSFEMMTWSLLRRTRHFVQGLQLNMLPWLEKDFAPFFWKLKKQYPHVLLMLQAYQSMMRRYTPEQIAERLLGMPVDYILFDPSQSRGLAFEAQDMHRYIAAVRARSPINIVVAGGLGAKGALSRQFAPLVNEHVNLSCDAFWGLKDEAARKLDLTSVDRYLQEWRRTILDQLTI